MVKAPGFQHRDAGLIPGWGTKIPHVSWSSKMMIMTIIIKS